MLPLAHAGLTTPAVAGPGCNEVLGLNVLVCEREVIFSFFDVAGPVRTGAILDAGRRERSRTSLFKTAALKVYA